MPAPDAELIRLVARVGDALGTATRPVTLEAELRRTLAGLRRVFGAAACSYARVEPDGATLRFVAADGAGAEAITGVTMPLSRGIAGWVALSGEPLRIGDLSTESRFARDIAETTAYVPTTILAAPVVDAGGEVVGVVEVLDPTIAGADPGHDLAVLGLVAGQLAGLVRLTTAFDALGTELIRSLADPDATGELDDTLGTLVRDDTGPALTETASAFRTLAAAGPDAAGLAARMLREVAAYVGARR
jgi:GAF domain-containing protein